jgi:hypothetical protein
MGLAVIPRLGELLRERNLALVDLEQQIGLRFGLTVEPGSLERFADAEPVQQANLELAGAAASILGVGLDDLFDVILLPGPADSGPGALPEAQARRLTELLECQQSRPLSEVERRELDDLVTSQGRSIREHFLREYAAERGITVERARQESAASLTAALAWWQEFSADPSRQQQLVSRSKRRRHHAPA